MSSSPTGQISTTSSSTNSPSLPDPAPVSPAGRGRGRVAVIACGAIAQPCGDIVSQRGWRVDIYPLPPLLHNRPGLIAGEVESLALALREDYVDVAVAYADCGTYGALDQVCERLGMRRLAGLHCYDVYAGPRRLEEFFAEQPGTYVLTDFLVKSFARTVLVELGLDRYPELRDIYFGNYTRVVWLAQQPGAELARLAADAAAAIGLPLTTVDVGTSGLERELELLVSAAVVEAGQHEDGRRDERPASQR
ncbi:MAG: DUF1638 domain-containing protein [Nocardioidaceae bacterium]